MSEERIVRLLESQMLSLFEETADYDNFAAQIALEIEALGDEVVLVDKACLDAWQESCLKLEAESELLTGDTSWI